MAPRLALAVLFLAGVAPVPAGAQVPALRALFERMADMIGSPGPSCYHPSRDPALDQRVEARAEVGSIRAEFSALYVSAVQEMTSASAEDVLARTKAETEALQAELDGARAAGDGARYAELAGQQKAIHQRGIDALHALFDPTGMDRLNALAAEFEKAAAAADRRIEDVPDCVYPYTGIRG